jgi:hypothetical protein
MKDFMDEHLLEVREHLGDGYQPLVDFETWRVALLRWKPGMQPAEISFVERHTHTDEVFVLLLGSAMLLLAGNALSAGDLNGLTLQVGKLYNVKQNAWHSLLLSRDASILIVENRDTGDQNTEYCPLTSSQKQSILDFFYHKSTSIFQYARFPDNKFMTLVDVSLSPLNSLAGLRYSSPVHIVTMVTKGHKCIFGKIIDPVVTMYDLGRIAYDCWLNLTDHFAHRC